MGKVVAITPIQHGTESGEVEYYAVGDELAEGESFDEAALTGLIENGSAVEIGGERSYSASPDPSLDPGAADTDTRARDKLIAESLSAASPEPADQPAATGAVSSGTKMAGDTDKTIGQAAAEDAAKGSGGE